jgi:hypothetical protein
MTQDSNAQTSDVTVDRIELSAIAPDSDMVTFGAHLGAMHEAMIVARLGLSNGVEAIAGLTTYTEHEYDRTAFSSAVLMAPFVLGKSVFDIPKIYTNMRALYSLGTYLDITVRYRFA